jgi:DNA-binding CsgD family transcriptional regulator/tetratricopeptide (TPR) repeat protein
VELLERDDALAVLDEAHRAARAGEGRVVFVTGEPGIGKTALVRAFLQRLPSGSRVLVGTCDDLAIPRPLGPVLEALRAESDGRDVHRLLVDELAAPPHPAVLVLEDVHWADEATLDAVTILGRRIASLPALVVLTYRAGGAPGALTDSIREATFVELEPLSEAAVAALAGDDADAVFAVTGGNAFYVTELLASRSAADLPPTVATAVVGRAARLSDEARGLVDLVAVVPSRTPTVLLDAAVPRWSVVAEEAERAGLLEIEPSCVRFRHELARHAIRADIPAARFRRLNASVVDALLATNGDPADVVHYAEAAGADEIVAVHALPAARRAAAVASNREALSHYRRAADFAGRRAPSEQAAFLEELAAAEYVVGFTAEAIAATQRARTMFAELGDQAAVGRCTRFLSRLYWVAGEGATAREYAEEAVAILEPLGESVELAGAYSTLSQLAMLDEDAEQALAWGERALTLSSRLGDEPTRVHALVNVGSIEAFVDPDDVQALLDAHAAADAAHQPLEGARALANLAHAEFGWARPESAARHAEAGSRYAESYDLHWLAAYLHLTSAWLALRAGDWEAAERVVREELRSGRVISHLLARTVATDLAVRRGDADTAELLTSVADAAYGTGELQRIAPLLEAATVAAIVSGLAPPAERFRGLAEAIEWRGAAAGCNAIRIAAWAAVAGVDVALGRDPPEPYRSMLRRDWRGAADAFGAVGWSFERAFFLSLLDEEDALDEAIELARALGAAPLARQVGRRLRRLGLAVPRGAGAATRANPFGLTARQVEVLRLLAEGQTNAEIADRLVLSTRTVEHHVAAVLTKLGAATRRDAVRRAAELAL